jgi:AMMECR1 domain-containing protein
MTTSYAKLARSAVEWYVKSRRLLDVPSHVPADLVQQRACYVYVFENPGRRLRALYGQPLPRCSSLVEEIITNATAALGSETAGRAIRRPELASLAYTVAILEPLQRISDAAQLDPYKFGLFVRSEQGKSTVLLPQRNGIETSQDQIATALRESGINLRQETATMYRFGVSYYD